MPSPTTRLGRFALSGETLSSLVGLLLLVLTLPVQAQTGIPQASEGALTSDNPLLLLLPYEWEPLITLACLIPLVLYMRGLRHLPRPGLHRTLSFLLGLGLMYVVTQTRFDYYAQFVFFIHRGQHLILHHLAAMLIVLANPLPVMSAGSPDWLRRGLGTLWHSFPIRTLYQFIQFPPIAGFLFVGLIYYWLIPSIHFTAMLSSFWYQVMNWSMAIDGLAFWWLVLNPAPFTAPNSLGHGKRCLLLAAVAFPQIFLGAYITLFGNSLYEIYELCGRPWPISPEADQALGGLLTWIPGAMMSALGVVLVMSQWSRHDKALHQPAPSNDSPEVQS